MTQWCGCKLEVEWIKKLNSNFSALCKVNNTETVYMSFCKNDASKLEDNSCKIPSTKDTSPLVLSGNVLQDDGIFFNTKTNFNDKIPKCVLYSKCRNCRGTYNWVLLGSYWSNWKSNSLGQLGSKSPTRTTYLLYNVAIISLLCSPPLGPAIYNFSTTSPTECSPWTEAPGSYSWTFALLLLTLQIHSI